MEGLRFPWGVLSFTKHNFQSKDAKLVFFFGSEFNFRLGSFPPHQHLERYS